MEFIGVDNVGSWEVFDWFCCFGSLLWKLILLKGFFAWFIRYFLGFYSILKERYWIKEKVIEVERI